MNKMEIETEIANRLNQIKVNFIKSKDFECLPIIFLWL